MFVQDSGNPLYEECPERPHIDVILREKIHQLVQALFAQRITNMPKVIDLFSDGSVNSKKIYVAGATSVDRFFAGVQSVGYTLERLLGSISAQDLQVLDDIVPSNKSGASNIFQVWPEAYAGGQVEQLHLSRVIPLPNDLTKDEIEALQILERSDRIEHPTHALMRFLRGNLRINLIDARNPENNPYRDDYKIHLLCIPGIEIEMNPSLREIIAQTRDFIYKIRKSAGK